MLQKATFSLKVGAKVIFFCDIYKFLSEKSKKATTKTIMYSVLSVFLRTFAT
jgi:hypothetical protein